MIEQLTHCYVDDSIHDSFGFIVLAFVFSSYDLDTPVRAALAVAGLDPEREEFKSGVRMDRNPAMQAARAQLIAVIREHAHVGVVIARRHHIVPLGKQCLQALCQEADSHIVGQAWHQHPQGQATSQPLRGVRENASGCWPDRIGTPGASSL